MKGFKKRLYEFGFFKLSTTKVEKWIIQKKIDSLIYALKHGDYKIRAKALQGLFRLEFPDILKILQQSIDDPIRLVSLTACDLLEEWDDESKWQKQISLKRKYWELIQLKEKEQLGKRVGLAFSTIWQKADMYEMTRNSRFESVKSNMGPNG